MDRQRVRTAIGRVLMVAIPGIDLPEATRATLNRLAVGGIILFRRNVDSAEQLAALTAELRSLESRPLIGIDHEGGRVLRLDAPFTAFPSMATVGATQDAELAHAVGLAMGVELSAAGIDLDFAPVLDVNSNPDNPTIGDRSFSNDPRVAATMGVAFMRGLHEGGVLSCGKHFPGHGDTDIDSHLALPVVHRDRAVLEATELVPFRAVITAGIPLLMTAHVLYPHLDPERPATLSSAILGELLRNEMGFDGVVVSDDLEMRAISDRLEVGAAAVETLAAGADLLLFCADLERAEIAAAAIERAVIDGQLALDVVEAAARRVCAIRKPARAHGRAVSDLPIGEHLALLDRLSSIRT